MSRSVSRLVLAGVLGLGLSMFGAVASAQDAPPVQYKQKTTYDFDDDVVEGDMVRPDGEFIDSKKAAKHSSLIKIRENFIPEMLKSAEDI
jgi:hypothetical protein